MSRTIRLALDATPPQGFRTREAALRASAEANANPGCVVMHARDGREYYYGDAGITIDSDGRRSRWIVVPR